MAFTAPCGCPSEGDERVRLTTHLAGCRFLEDLIEGSCCGAAEPVESVPRERGTDELALADTYWRHAGDLAAIEDAYADDSWRTWT